VCLAFSSLRLCSWLVFLPSLNPSPGFAPGKMDTVRYGVAYYPEYMPYQHLDKDVELITTTRSSVSIRG
jgi:hypothetical protein